MTEEAVPTWEPARRWWAIRCPECGLKWTHRDRDHLARLMELHQRKHEPAEVLT